MLDVWPSYRTAKFNNYDEYFRRMMRRRAHERAIGGYRRIHPMWPEIGPVADRRRQRAALTLRRHLPLRFRRYLSKKYRRSAREARLPSYLIRQRGLTPYDVRNIASYL